MLRFYNFLLEEDLQSQPRLKKTKTKKTKKKGRQGKSKPKKQLHNRADSLSNKVQEMLKETVHHPTRIKSLFRSPRKAPERLRIRMPSKKVDPKALKDEDTPYFNA